MADKKQKKGKKVRGGDSKRTDGAPPYSSIATHPRASMRVRQAKGWGGLVGFGLTAALSLKAGVPVLQTFERALLFGVIGFLVAWSLSVFLWRQLIVAEQHAAVDELQRRREEKQSSKDAGEAALTPATASGSASGPA